MGELFVRDSELKTEDTTIELSKTQSEKKGEAKGAGKKTKNDNGSCLFS